MMDDDSRDIGVRLHTLEEFLQVPPPSPTLLYVATGCVMLSLLMGVLLLIQRSLPVSLIAIAIVAFIGSGVLSFMLHQAASKKWKNAFVAVLTDCMQRMEFIANEVNRFVGSYDDQTRSYFHSMTQTKIRTYFILQEVLQKLSSENNTLMHALEAKDYSVMLEFSETLLGPLIVRESPIRAGELTIPRDDLENFLAEISSELVEATKKDYLDNLPQ